MLKRIAIAGALGQPFGTFAALSQSDDGVTWDPPLLPLENGISVGLISSGDDQVVIGTSIGTILVTADMVSFTEALISDGVNIVGLGYSGTRWVASANRFNAANYGPYPRGSETSQVYLASDPLGPWNMVWTNPSHDARVYQMKRFEQAPISPGVSLPAWVMVGSAENHAEVWYSINDGFTWTQAAVPQGIQRIMSVGLAEFDGTRWYWGCNGAMYRSEHLSDTEWSGISVSQGSNIVDIIGTSGYILAAGQDRAYYSPNGLIMESISSEGYSFDRVAMIENDGDLQKMVFARGQLNQYTQWTLGSDNRWVPSTSNIHVAGSTLLV